MGHILVHYRWGVFAVLGLILGLFLLFGPSNTEEAQALHAPEEQQLLALINDYRQANGVAPLSPSETLSNAAWRHSDDMATHGFFSHASEASSYYPVGSASYDRIALEGYPANALTAENMAWNQPTPEDVFNTWLNSAVHNANMLDGTYKSIGLGHVGPYWTATFGSV